MTELPAGVTISKISITSLIMVFVSYLVIHIVIAVVLKQKKEELGNLKDYNTEEYKRLTKIVKWTELLYKWFPAIAIVLILIGFYL